MEKGTKGGKKCNDTEASKNERLLEVKSETVFKTFINLNVFKSNFLKTCFPYVFIHRLLRPFNIDLTQSKRCTHFSYGQCSRLSRALPQNPPSVQ